VQIYIDDQHSLRPRPYPLHGYGHVIEVAHPPGPVGGGMVPERPDEREGGLALQGRLCGADGIAWKMISEKLIHKLFYVTKFLKDLNLLRKAYCRNNIFGDLEGQAERQALVM